MPRSFSRESRLRRMAVAEPPGPPPRIPTVFPRIPSPGNFPPVIVFASEPVGDEDLAEGFCQRSLQDRPYSMSLPVRMRSASRYFCDVFSITSGGSLGPGAVLFHGSGSRSEAARLLVEAF